MRRCDCHPTRDEEVKIRRIASQRVDYTHDYAIHSAASGCSPSVHVVKICGKSWHLRSTEISSHSMNEYSSLRGSVGTSWGGIVLGSAGCIRDPIRSLSPPRCNIWIACPCQPAVARC